MQFLYPKSSSNHFYITFQDIFNHMDSSKEQETILVISHGCFMLYLMRYLLASTDQFKITHATDIFSKAAPNTGVTKLAIHELNADGRLREIQVLAEHNIQHLEIHSKNDTLHAHAKTTRLDGCIHQ